MNTIRVKQVHLQHVKLNLTNYTCCEKNVDQEILGMLHSP